MRRLSALILALCALFLLTSLALAPGLAQAAGRYALVIGNSAYSQKPLKNPANDARDVGRALERLGFEVLLKTNVSQRDMEDSIRDFGVKLKRGGVGIFYFAGHGIQVQGVNYLVPIGARLSGESDARYECVDAGRVLGKMEEAGNELNIVILDACRNNPFASSFRSVDHGLARMDAPTGSLVAYATAPNSVASDGSGQNGLYTKHLLSNINTPGVPIEEVFKRVRIGVMGETGKKQVPWESSSLAGYFYLAGGQPQGAVAQASQQLSAAQAAQQQRQLDERLKAYIAGLEAEKRLVEKEKAELVRRREQLDAETAQQVKAAQAPQEARLKEQLAILEAERRKLETERAELMVARARAEQAQLAAQKAAKAGGQGSESFGASLGTSSVGAPSSAKAGTSASTAAQGFGAAASPQPEDRTAVLRRLAGVWRLETENGLALPRLTLKPGGDTLYGFLDGESQLARSMSLTGLAMEGGNLHLRLSVQTSDDDQPVPGRYLRVSARGRKPQRVIECVGYLRATENGAIPLFCQRVDSDARSSQQGPRVAGRMVRVSQQRGW